MHGEMLSSTVYSREMSCYNIVKHSSSPFFLSCYAAALFAGITNAEFVAGKAEDTIDRVLNKYLLPKNGSADNDDDDDAKFTSVVAVVDPPRAGTSP